MATKAVATKKTSTALATLDYSDELASIAKRLQSAGTADRIKTSNAKVFILPDKSEHEELDCIIDDFIAYNRYSNQVERLNNRYEEFVEEFATLLQRQGRG